MKRRPRHQAGKRLGAVETQRSGAVKLDWDAIYAVSQAIYDNFKSCGAGAKTPYRILGLRIPAFDPQTKEMRNVSVDVLPESNLPALVSGGNVTRRKKSGKREDEITIKPRAGLCARANIWVPAIRSVLAHELTHASDPALSVPQKHSQVELLKRIKKGEASFCDYLNDPLEVKSHLNEVRAQLQSYDEQRQLQSLRERGHMKSPADALRLSSRWREIQKCYTGKARQRFLKMAAIEVG